MTGKGKTKANYNKKLILKTLGITLLAFILSMALEAPFSASTSSIFSGPEKHDFTITDIYAQIANDRPVRKLEDRVVIVDIGIKGREEIAEVLEVLSLCGAKAVGLDVNFEEPTEDDTRLLNAISSVENIVLPLGVRASGDKFEIDDRPFFYEEISGPKYGVVNIPTATRKSSVREYAVGFPVGNDTLPSFVTAIAGLAAPDALAELHARGNNLETTAYHSKEFRVYPADDVTAHAEEFTDKIVLVGAMSDAGDMHPTPINSYEPGIMIHAAGITTLLDREWYVSLPRYTDYLIAIIICFLIVFARIGIRNDTKGLVVRILQVILAYAAVRLGYSLFIDRHIVCNFSTTLLMIAFGIFAVDIWNGFEVLLTKLYKRIKQRKNKEEDPSCENYS